MKKQILTELPSLFMSYFEIFILSVFINMLISLIVSLAFYSSMSALFSIIERIVSIPNLFVGSNVLIVLSVGIFCFVFSTTSIVKLLYFIEDIRSF